ncbi:M20 aminoacylase family protein [Nissabacter sp. SGAir0207]|uniref:M20 aminoacylase family protein n=1 Tax=Nissabacter sp. SGAir0207 TaxID=2126321 RepID=UPI0010CD3A97|nr:M20 aminoacylase family protein [Nissabacter sp. SGAir0207]QCR38521.1 amidohydrolase [Nissabacter sp. SGAir0207]
MALPYALIAEAISWRHEFHAYPELGFQEHHTSRRIAELLETFGFEVHCGLAGTGVVGTLRNGPGATIGLRADMDALPIQERLQQPYSSTLAGHMHACGHDGHMAMLLGAARHLSQTRHFSGTLHLVFQPAEENLAGARKMIEDGLFRLFPMDAIFGMHNWPGLPQGHVALNNGAMMASLDTFEVTLTGKGCHAAMPDEGADPLVAAAELILALQTIPARRLSPLDSAVISVTQLSAGEAINVIPERAVLKGTVRCLHANVRDRVETLIGEFVTHLPRSFGVRGEMHYQRGYPVTLNHADWAEKVRCVAERVVGKDHVHWGTNPSMASEDFAFMLHACPGAYFWLGADKAAPSPPLHSACFDFNDDSIETGIALWVELAEQLLPHRLVDQATPFPS